jgi:hypothetical protein
MTSAAERRMSGPVRLTVATELGHGIDGAWWPRTVRMALELPELIHVLGPRLGEIVDINVNWTTLQRPPDFNALGWEGKQQHVITLVGRDARVSLLVVPYPTSTALAVMVLRRAADLPILSDHRDTQVFRTADSIVRAARNENAPGVVRGGTPS